MSRPAMIGVISLGTTLLAGCAPAAAPPTPDPPPFVSVTFVGITAAPLKADGTCWDPFCSIRDKDGQRLGAALATLNPYAAVASVLTPVMFEALSKPDIAGTAALLIGGVPKQVVALPRREDGFTPQWNVTWRHVALDGSAVLRVAVEDMDPDIPLSDSDPMGTFLIARGDMYAALLDGHVVQVPVHTQTNRQVLVAGLHVIAEP